MASKEWFSDETIRTSLPLSQSVCWFVCKNVTWNDVINTSRLIFRICQPKKSSMFFFHFMMFGWMDGVFTDLFCPFVFMHVLLKSFRKEIAPHQEINFDIELALRICWFFGYNLKSFPFGIWKRKRRKNWNHFHSFPLSRIHHTLDQAYINKIYVKRYKACVSVSILAFISLNLHPHF